MLLKMKYGVQKRNCLIPKLYVCSLDSFASQKEGALTAILWTFPLHGFQGTYHEKQKLTSNNKQ